MITLFIYPYVPNMNRSFKYGDGFFETIRVEKGQPTLWPFHVDRILQSCRITGMEQPSEAVLADLLKSLLEQSTGMGMARARVTFYRKGNGGYRPESVQTALHIEVNPFSDSGGAIFPTHTGSYKDLLSDVQALPPRITGLYSEASQSYSPFSMLKSTSAMLYVQAALYAGKMGWDEALVMNNNGHVIESTDSNIYAVYNNRIYTPPLRSGCVAGVCRAYLMDRYDFLEATLSFHDLKSAHMVFCSNALHGVRRIEVRE